MNSQPNAGIHRELIAHVRRDDDGCWAPPHSLLDHLNGTANLAEEFSDKFGSGKWGRVLGLAHDAGKGRLKWQEYLRTKSGYDEEAHLEGKRGKLPHAIYGAMLAEEHFKNSGRFLAYCIAGHHAGLPDWSPEEGEGQASLYYQEQRANNLLDIDMTVRELIETSELGTPPWAFERGVDIALWIRMLYSSLVDADFLDTESYMNPDKSSARGQYCSMQELQDRLNRYVKKIEKESKPSQVNLIRRQVRNKCQIMAEEPRGVFSLTVPTGGGKTLSSLAFAIAHSIKWKMDRIIYVIPYTSIIEQNAEVFRSALGSDQVVEHHSNLDEDDSTPKSRLASENWDARLIVTTTVQFFESLFAAKPSRCRKLHNIANSIVILDEAQLLPAEYLQPILDSMQLLVQHYNVSFLISTATQPAFGERVVDGKTFKGLKGIKEVMGKDVNTIFASLRRADIQLPEDLKTPIPLENVAGELVKHERVLCIVSDRKSCRELFRMMPEGTFHLSALMCGQHRSETIEKIKHKLSNNQSVRVISTQLVEAGVDIDFPVVYRAFAGLDSIAQSAGRCNREGKLPENGKVMVFVPPRRPPSGILRKAEETARSIFNAGSVDYLEPSLFERYFSNLYWKVNSLDKKGIVDLLYPKNVQKDCGIYFRTASKRFRMIDDSNQKAIIVPYGKSGRLIDELRQYGPSLELKRKLQRYTVEVYEQDFIKMLARGSLEEVQPGIYALASEIEYKQDIGLLTDEVLYDPEEFIR